jgi:hypothetical protein
MISDHGAFDINSSINQLASSTVAHVSIKSSLLTSDQTTLEIGSSFIFVKIFHQIFNIDNCFVL